MRAIIYKRVSTQIQVNDGVSLDVQEERLKAYILAQGWEHVNTYEDAGLSGANSNRPAYKQMMKDASQKKFDCIVVYKLDRLTRSVRDFHDLATVLDEYNVSIVSVTQNLDTSTAVGRLLRNILVDFANFEREMIVERTMDVKYNLAHKGQWLGGERPYGYTNVNKKLVIVPDQAKIVKSVYEDYLKGMSVKQLMYKYGFKSKGPVTRILWNPIYTGLISYSKTTRKSDGTQKRLKPIEDWILVPGEHEAIITKETYDRVQELKKLNTNSPSPRVYDQIFNNLVYCKCGKRMYYNISHNKRYNLYKYYRCQSTNSAEKGCGLSKREEWIEERVLKLLSDLTKAKNWNKLKDKLKKDKTKEINSNIQALENELNKNKNSIAGLIKKMAMEEIQPILNHIVAEVKKLENRNNELIAQIEKQRVIDNQNASFNEMYEVINKVTNMWEKSTREGRRSYAIILFKRITIYDDKIGVILNDPNIPEVFY